VGAEYIIMEKAPGVELEKLWPKMGIEDRWKTVQALASYRKSWASVSFAKFGSLYFTPAVSGESGTLEHDDILAFVDEGIEQCFVGPGHVLIGGWSYGGLLSYIAVVRNGRKDAGEKKTWRYKGAIPGAGVSDQELQSMSSDFVHYSSEMSGSKKRGPPIPMLIRMGVREVLFGT